MRVSPGTGPCNQDDELTSRILTAVAEAEQCDPLDLPPLYEAVEPEALDELVRGPGQPAISFPYHGYRIKVTDSGEIEVTSK